MLKKLLQVSELRVGFPVGAGMAEAVHGVSLAIHNGETLGLVGESGSGKSVTALAIMRLIQTPGQILGGVVMFNDQDLLAMSEREMRRIRGREISMVFQDPLNSLNPAFTIGQQLIDVITSHQEVGRRSARNLAVEVLDLVGIPWPERRLGNYPHEFSGGMRQRVLIAMAIACRPRLLIADEPTTALDVTIQAQVIGVLRRLRKELGLTILFITHNLDLMAEICDRALVLYGGTVMEDASVEQLFACPRHPYTRSLLRCVPRIKAGSGKLESIEGAPPVLGAPVPGCPFVPRCPDKMEMCKTDRPQDILFGEHRVACWAANHLDNVGGS